MISDFTRPISILD